jgi:hypothetical protein
MDRLDVELYAERLARHAERAADDLADARLREAWCELERGVRATLGAADCARLEALGVLTPTDAAAAVGRAAIHRLQVAVEPLRVRT